MKCKECGAELPIDAQFCGTCGCPVERETYKQREKRGANKRKTTRRRAFVIVPIVLICLSLVGYKLLDMFWVKDIRLHPNYDNMTTRVTVDEYNKIELGMTYKEACRIVGGKGKLESIKGTAEFGSRSYVWAGECVDRLHYTDMSVTIDNSSKKIVAIHEYNLIDAEEILSNRHNEVQYKKYGKIKVGMTLNEVEELLGTKGVLFCSSSTKRDNSQTTWKEYIWTGPNDQEIYVDFENDIVEEVEEYGF